MNQVYLSGVVAETPVFVENENAAPRVGFALCVTHKTTRDEVKRELYQICAWNRMALWAKEHLRRGQGIALQGYLTQRMAQVEITASEIFLRQATGRRNDGNDQNNEEGAEK